MRPTAMPPRKSTTPAKKAPARKAPTNTLTAAAKAKGGSTKVTPLHHILIYRLVRNGKTYQDVADELGYAKNTVMRHFHDRHQEILGQRAAEQDLSELDLQLERLELQYLEALDNYELAKKRGDGTISLQAMILKIMDTKSDLLGLKAATKVDVSGEVISKVEWIETVVDATTKA